METEALRRRHAPDTGVLDRLLDAAAAEVRESGYARLTMRLVARRAGVSASTAYNHVASKEHLLASLFWRGLTALPGVDGSLPAADRVRGLVGGIAEMVIAEPELESAYRAALLADDPDARRVRDAIAGHLLAEFEGALGDELPEQARDAVRLAFVGAMVMAGAGVLSFAEVGDRISGVVRLLQ